VEIVERLVVFGDKGPEAEEYYTVVCLAQRFFQGRGLVKLLCRGEVERCFCMKTMRCMCGV
jgi:hypothetical protein